MKTEILKFSSEMAGEAAVLLAERHKRDGRLVMGRAESAVIGPVDVLAGLGH